MFLFIMITYNDIYEAKKNPLVLFESPQSTEGWHLFFAYTDTTRSFGGKK